MNETLDENYENVTKLMLNCRFMPQMQGFDYIRSAVLYYLKQDKKKKGITTELYPMLAKQYNTKETSVERNIRKCIDTAFRTNGLLSINDYFGAVVYTNSFKFSNFEMISVLVEIIRLDKVRKRFCDKVEVV